MAGRNRLLVPQAKRALESMKEEIAREMGVELGADTSARANGSVGGEMVKRLVSMAERQLES
ncbi:alpha/beta-type small acid-soluble spore protein [Staphylospora marina]|uniref:alpha/beta-type small acid-soluble spore protein n=1 Tax=Staphylospora marina TaxID=2490858 RepID=UPI000F5BD90A|nr:alpha/beta-type small acid-soluble spore protein [Staphylospora marina]